MGSLFLDCRLLAQEPTEIASVCQSPSPINNDDPLSNNQNHHPQILGQRERSTSAPNVCFNSIGQVSESDEFILQKYSKGGYSTLHGNHQYVQLSSEFASYYFFHLSNYIIFSLFHYALSF